jgi:hypothetical protein
MPPELDAPRAFALIGVEVGWGDMDGALGRRWVPRADLP